MLNFLRQISMSLLAGIVAVGMGCSQENASQFSEYDSDLSEPEQTGPLNTAHEKSITNGSLPVAARKPGGSADVRSLKKDANDNRQHSLLAAGLGNAGVSLVEQVRTTTNQTTTKKSTSSATTGSPISAKRVLVKPRKVKLLVKDRKFRVEGPENAIRVTYDDINLLKVLNMDPVLPDAHKMFPDWLKNLDGKRIRIRGFMSPSFKSTGLTSFLMGRDNKACCFPGRAKIYDLFPVKLRDGVTTEYIQNRPFDVVGVFQIKPWQEDGEWLRLYQIVDAVIIQ
ncbi:MAG: hypothetical protein Tsb009_03680 [Planctomycetaceae bacterium]